MGEKLGLKFITAANIWWKKDFFPHFDIKSTSRYGGVLNGQLITH